MEIVSIRLSNVRRFTDPVEVVGFGPGVNVLSAPNEHGKSTVFDALHAAFFISYTSMKAEIKSLVPYSKGDPEVSVAFAAQGTAWRLEKCWSGSKARQGAKLWRDGTLVGQAGQAEDMLARLIAAPADGGPAGLLWVRQGLTDLAEKGPEQAARQSLLTSVAGEVDAMTGGRQMEAIHARVAEDLGKLLTSTGRPKKGGPLDLAMAEVADLSAKADQLRALSHELSDALVRRIRLRAEVRRLSDPEMLAAQTKAHEAAQAALDAGERHHLALQSARDKAAAAQAALAQITDARARLVDALAEHEAAQTALASASATRTEAEAALAEAQGAMAEASTSQTAAADAARAARARFQQAVAAERAAAAAERRADVATRLAAAEKERSLAETARATAQALLAPAALDTLRKRHAELELAQRARDRAAPAIRLSYDGPGRARIDGKDVPDGLRLPLPEGAEIHLDGIGHMVIDPGMGSDLPDIAQAQAALDKALAAAGADSIAAAEEAVRQRSVAEAQALEAEARLRALAPRGLEALRADLASLPAAPEDTGPIPSSTEAAAHEQTASAKLVEADARLATARAARDTASTGLARAEAALAAAGDRTGRAKAALAGADDPSAALDALEEQTSQAKAASTASSEARDRLEQERPDIATLTARRDRAAQAIRNTQDDKQRLSLELRGLDTLIETRANAAIEEDLAETDERLAGARRRLSALEEERDVLVRLAGALDTAQSAARERYVAPVLQELEPLVRMLWPEAELRIDPDSVMPAQLVRRGTEEPFPSLSGGTREQIALLVRLAFARMLAREGRPAPVILDDAIVYSDDDRIVTMFDALTRQAQDLQVIVFSCRSRAFRDLGGRSLSIRPVSPATSP